LLMCNFAHSYHIVCNIPSWDLPKMPIIKLINQKDSKSQKPIYLQQHFPKNTSFILTQYPKKHNSYFLLLPVNPIHDLSSVLPNLALEDQLRCKECYADRGFPILDVPPLVDKDDKSSASCCKHVSRKSMTRASGQHPGEKCRATEATLQIGPLDK